MNSRLELFNKQLERCGLDAQIGNESTTSTPCKVLIKDIDNKGLIETKHIYVPSDVMVAIGDTITLMDKKYMVLNISENSVFRDGVVQEIYHSIKVKYSWMELMQFDVLVQGVNQVIVDTSMMTYDDTSVYILIQRNDTSKQILRNTRIFLFDRVYKIETITWENGNVLNCKCAIEGINPSDDTTNQIADNSQLNPPTPKYTITSSASAYGSISPLGEVVVEQGKSQVFTITCNEGYEIDTVLVDDVEVELSDLSYTFSNVVTNHTISVSFKEIEVPPLPPSLSIIETNGETELWKGWDNEYSLKDGTIIVSPVTWSVNKDWVTISQNGTKCTISYNSLNYVGEYIVLTALYNGNNYTLTIKCVDM